MTGILTAVLAAVVAAGDAAPPSITLGPRQADGTPTRQGFALTGGGNIVVAQPGPDTVVITMTGVAVAGAHPLKDSFAELAYELAQHFEVKADPRARNLRLVLEAEAIGLLRSHKCSAGTARVAAPTAAVTPCGSPGGPALIEIALPEREVTPGQNLSVNDHGGPVEVPIVAGKFVLTQRSAVQAAHPHHLLPCKTASAEFAPDPALNPLWIDAWEPFHGADKKNFGFWVTLRVAAD